MPFTHGFDPITIATKYAGQWFECIDGGGINGLPNMANKLRGRVIGFRNNFVLMEFGKQGYPINAYVTSTLTVPRSSILSAWSVKPEDIDINSNTNQNSSGQTSSTSPTSPSSASPQLTNNHGLDAKVLAEQYADQLVKVKATYAPYGAIVEQDGYCLGRVIGYRDHSFVGQIYSAVVLDFGKLSLPFLKCIFTVTKPYSSSWALTPHYIFLISTNTLSVLSSKDSTIADWPHFCHCGLRGLEMFSGFDCSNPSCKIKRRKH